MTWNALQTSCFCYRNAYYCLCYHNTLPWKWRRILSHQLRANFIRFIFRNMRMLGKWHTFYSLHITLDCLKLCSHNTKNVYVQSSNSFNYIVKLSRYRWLAMTSHINFLQHIVFKKPKFNYKCKRCYCIQYTTKNIQ